MKRFGYLVRILLIKSAPKPMIVRTVAPADWPQMATIYQQGIDTGNATMETVAPPPEKMAQNYLTTPS